MLRGIYQYFALHHCERKLSWIRCVSGSMPWNAEVNDVG
jgi:hypothetical protein